MKRGSFDICLADSTTQTIHGYVTEDGLFGVDYRRPLRAWVITHIPTGNKVPYGAPTRKAAAEAIRSLREWSIDWTKGTLGEPPSSRLGRSIARASAENRSWQKYLTVSLS